MEKINYHNRKFKPLSLTHNSEVGSDTFFLYQQEGKLLHCTYNGGNIRYGHLIGTVDDTGHIDMRYHQLSNDGILMTGICHSTPEINSHGKIILHEKWQWTSGDRSKGESVLIETD